MSTDQTTTEARGWYWPSNSRKAHYYVDGRSLCGRYGFPGKLGHPDDKGGCDDDCTPCSRKLGGVK